MFSSAISDIIVSVTACGKQGKMSRMTLLERVSIEAGIYTHKTLTEIAKGIGKSRRYIYIYISEKLRKNGTMVQKFRENIPLEKAVTMPRAANEPVCAVGKEVTEHIPLWRGDVRFYNGKIHLVCFAMLKYMKPAVKRTRLKPDLALKQLCNGC